MFYTKVTTYIEKSEKHPVHVYQLTKALSKFREMFNLCPKKLPNFSSSDSSPIKYHRWSYCEELREWQQAGSIIWSSNKDSHMEYDVGFFGRRLAFGAKKCTK